MLQFYWNVFHHGRRSIRSGNILIPDLLRDASFAETATNLYISILSLTHRRRRHRCHRHHHHQFSSAPFLRYRTAIAAPLPNLPEGMQFGCVIVRDPTALLSF